MEKNQVQKKENRSKIISVRTFPSYSKWMSKNNVSPSKIFNLAIEELMKNDK